ncbi:Wzz/FepE/Etk N-terminal domain-containing protein, partial [Balneolaceae bacterium ANBcel3]|nr:Wzz/FepE/Etk N-terminal domain-containing protein [Balneolaceae bacterium ANBcel3]
MSNEKNDEHHQKGTGSTPGPAEGQPEYRLVQVGSFPEYHTTSDDEIDLIELLKTVWQGRRTIIYSVVAFMALGLFVALCSGEEYTSQVKLMPEVRQEANLGRLGGVARQFGVSGQAQPSEGIPASLYPDVTRSLPLMMLLMEHEVYAARHDTTATLYMYLTELNPPSAVDIAKKYTIGLPFTVLGGIRSLFEDEEELRGEIWLEEPSPVVQIIRMNRIQWEVIEDLRERINTSYNDQNGTIEVRVQMPDAEVAAEVAYQVVLFLTDYIKAYRTEKAAGNVMFIEGRYEEARQRFEEAQERLARFRDENRGQLTELARTREQRLQSEYDLTFNLYNSMAERFEEARITLQQETPVVNVIEPAAVPDKRSSPKRARIMIIYV